MINFSFPCRAVGFKRISLKIYHSQLDPRLETLSKIRACKAWLNVLPLIYRQELLSFFMWIDDGFLPDRMYLKSQNMSEG